MLSKGQSVGLDWNCITQLHSQVMTGTCELTNSIALSHYECVLEETRQEVIQLKSQISIKLGMNVGFGE